MKDKDKRLNVEIPENIWKAIEHFRVDNGITYRKDAVIKLFKDSKLLKKYLDSESK
jgi:hypothetical protein